MNVRELIPWGWKQDQVPASYRGDRNPFLTLHREMNRLFDDIYRGFDQRMPFAFTGRSGFGGWPSVEITDRENEVKLTAELPGLEEKDVEIFLSDGVLTLRGEKRAESEDEENQFSECFYGRFERRIPLGYDIDESKVNATFKNGVLSVTLPKTEQGKAKGKRIAISSS
ncbi:Hsp20/alpha crystallin family protein [Sinorhizobium numidicum]|uniref:Hsp20/alpha crystallin family protein n=1 Tax=Sinorhizobium numidicum TaxID=680248 RepID=A0ABY8CS86_9HYPH|nr:Hsp20/alpha crystallin family protein [Sinorhizobium numidicum]WEX75518.1 Hsp20/alpha crystallin family protein [Sinorhizobium numidicum]WEX81515.1 Hsp20/alpha crystallin family protein [Sinorhizobium numidicum]